jgi:5-formyltetrahydrofolate cyclo-ligase
MAERAPQASRIALTFDCQLVDEVPVESHDQLVNMVITESRLLKVSD